MPAKKQSKQEEVPATITVDLGKLVDETASISWARRLEALYEPLCTCMNAIGSGPQEKGQVDCVRVDGQTIYALAAIFDYLRSELKRTGYYQLKGVLMRAECDSGLANKLIEIYRGHVLRNLKTVLMKGVS